MTEGGTITTTDIMTAITIMIASATEPLLREKECLSAEKNAILMMTRTDSSAAAYQTVVSAAAVLFAIYSDFKYHFIKAYRFRHSSEWRIFDGKEHKFSRFGYINAVAIVKTGGI